MKTISLHLPRPLIKSREPVAILPEAEYESLIETIQILSDHKLLRRIESALHHLSRGRFFTHQQVFHPEDNE